MLGVAPEAVTLDHVGLNHLTWERAAYVDGVDRLPELLASRMDELAAEVVNLTMKLDGPDSPIAKALAARRDGRQDAGERGISLADRVRALQKANSTS